ncbi:hypothetical protein TUM4438_37000 [Shewanella sairae]|uniref:Uncharacterized protein n=1 Tax=Shewanella sairae TaxID=190310 RepID=A0ABQ4PPC0_9GAMM|nr:hypothetical protein TUM4438_37000 [Shewanella sairae]
MMDALSDLGQGTWIFRDVSHADLLLLNSGLIFAQREEQVRCLLKHPVTNCSQMFSVLDDLF